MNIQSHRGEIAVQTPHFIAEKNATQNHDGHSVVPRIALLPHGPVRLCHAHRREAVLRLRTLLRQNAVVRIYTRNEIPLVVVVLCNFEVRAGDSVGVVGRRRRRRFQRRALELEFEAVHRRETDILLVDITAEPPQILVAPAYMSR